MVVSLPACLPSVFQEDILHYKSRHTSLTGCKNLFRDDSEVGK